MLTYKLSLLSKTRNIGDNMQTNKEHEVKSLCNFIESHLYENVTIEHLEKNGFLSKSTIYRDFYNLIGYPVKEYIRRRQLSNALYLVKNSDFSLIQIAYDCGYSSQQALCRAIKGILGMTITEYKSKEQYYFFPMSTNGNAFDIEVKQEKFQKLSCIHYYDSQLKGIEDRALKHLFQIIPEYSGRIFGRNGMQKGKDFCYKLYIEDFQVGEECYIQQDFYASTTVSYEIAKINKAWNYLSHEWLPQSIYCMSQNEYLEEYIVKDNKPSKLRLYLPITINPNAAMIKIESCQQKNFLFASATGKNAEKEASRKVLGLLNKEEKNFLWKIDEFLINKKADKVIAGIKLPKEIDSTSEWRRNSVILLAEGKYIIISGNGIVEYDIMKNKLLSFVKEHGFEINENEIYGIYITQYGFKYPILNLYVRLF